MNSDKKSDPFALEIAKAYVSKYGSRFGLPEFSPHPSSVTLDKTLSRLAAEAYDRLQHTPHDESVANSYATFKREILAQYAHLTKAGIHIEPWTTEGQPYKNSAEMREDAATRKHLYFFRTGKDQIPHDHPLAEVSPIGGLLYNDLFRAVHDYFGHTMHPHEFGPKGELHAWHEHGKMFSDEARKALTTETHGQNSWVNFGPHSHLPVTERPYAEQKAGILKLAKKPISRHPTHEALAITQSVQKPGYTSDPKFRTSSDAALTAAETAATLHDKQPDEIRDISLAHYDAAFHHEQIASQLDSRIQEFTGLKLEHERGSRSGEVPQWILANLEMFGNWKAAHKLAEATHVRAAKHVNPEDLFEQGFGDHLPVFSTKPQRKSAGITVVKSNDVQKVYTPEYLARPPKDYLDIGHDDAKTVDAWGMHRKNLNKLLLASERNTNPDDFHMSLGNRGPENFYSGRIDHVKKQISLTPPAWAEEHEMKAIPLVANTLKERFPNYEVYTFPGSLLAPQKLARRDGIPEWAPFIRKIQSLKAQLRHGEDPDLMNVESEYISSLRRLAQFFDDRGDARHRILRQHADRLAGAGDSTPLPVRGATRSVQTHLPDRSILHARLHPDGRVHLIWHPDMTTGFDASLEKNEIKPFIRSLTSTDRTAAKKIWKMIRGDSDSGPTQLARKPDSPLYRHNPEDQNLTSDEVALLKVAHDDPEKGYTSLVDATADSGNPLHELLYHWFSNKDTIPYSISPHTGKTTSHNFDMYSNSPSEFNTLRGAATSQPIFHYGAYASPHVHAVNPLGQLSHDGPFSAAIHVTPHYKPGQHIVNLMTKAGEKSSHFRFLAPDRLVANYAKNIGGRFLYDFKRGLVAVRKHPAQLARSSKEFGREPGNVDLTSDETALLHIAHDDPDTGYTRLVDATGDSGHPLHDLLYHWFSNKDTIPYRIHHHTNGDTQFNYDQDDWGMFRDARTAKPVSSGGSNTRSPYAVTSLGQTRPNYNEPRPPVQFAIHSSPLETPGFHSVALMTEKEREGKPGVRGHTQLLMKIPDHVIAKFAKAIGGRFLHDFKQALVAVRKNPETEVRRRLARQESLGSSVPALNSATQGVKVKLAKQIMQEAGFGHQATPIIHVDQGATRAEVLHAVLHDGDPAAVRYTAAWYGLLSKAPALLAFHPTPTGTDFLHVFETTKKPRDVVKVTKAVGVPKFSVEPRPTGSRVFVYNPEGASSNVLHTLGESLDASHSILRGTGNAFGGSSGAPADARNQYRQIIKDYENQA